jgi:ferredoxin
VVTGAPVRVVVDQDLCISSGQCVLAAPDVFDQRDEDGVAELITATPPPGQEADVEQAARVCPARAIRVEPSPSP